MPIIFDLYGEIENKDGTYNDKLKLLQYET